MIDSGYNSLSGKLLYIVVRYSHLTGVF